MSGSKFVKFLMSIFKRQVNSSSNFASFFILMTHKLEAHTFPSKSYFEILKCSGENIPYLSCHFSQFSFSLHFFHSSVPWKRTPLYYFRLKVIYFARKGTNESKNFDNLKCSNQNSLNSYQLWNNKSVFLQILHHSVVSWDIIPLYFSLADMLYTLKKRSLSKYKFGEISREQSKVWNFVLRWFNFVQIM